MNGIKKLSLLVFLSVFISVGCSRSEVEDSPNSGATDGPVDERDVEFSPDTFSPEPGEDTPPPGEDTPPPGEDTPPPGGDTPPPGGDTPPPVTKSGIGLFYTPEELEIWNNRRLNGPYKENWDNRVYANARLFMDGKKDVSPWSGPSKSKNSCWTPDYTNEVAARGSRAIWANSAGFVYRVLKHAGEDAKAAPYFNKTKAFLLAHTTTRGINFRDGKLWCPQSYSGQGSIHFIAAWLRKLAITYSWLKEDMNDSDRGKFEHWLLGAGQFWVKHNEWHTGYIFKNRYQDDYTCNGPYCPGKLVLPQLYDGGPKYYQCHGSWNNRGSVNASAVGIIGIVVGNNVLRDKSKRYFQESLRQAVWPNGVYADIMRRGSSGWSYGMDFMGSFAQLADALARTGDNSLYEYSTRLGMAGSESKSGQPAKSLRQVIKMSANQSDGKVKIYTRGSLVHSMDNGKVNDSEWLFIQSNLYYKNPYITRVYNRTEPGIPSTARGTSASGWDRHTGDWGSYPDVEFMWAGLEGKIWPYGSFKGKKSQQNDHPLCDSSERNCSHAFETR